MTAIGTVVDWNALGDVVLASVLAGVGVTVAFSLAIYGSARFADLRAEGQTAAAIGFGLIGALGYAVCLGALAAGIIVMTAK